MLQNAAHVIKLGLAYIPGGPKKRPELCVTISARILYGAKFPLAHL